MNPPPTFKYPEFLPSDQAVGLDADFILRAGGGIFNEVVDTRDREQGKLLDYAEMVVGTYPPDKLVGYEFGIGFKPDDPLTVLLKIAQRRRLVELRNLGIVGENSQGFYVIGTPDSPGPTGPLVRGGGRIVLGVATTEPTPTVSQQPVPIPGRAPSGFVDLNPGLVVFPGRGIVAGIPGVVTEPDAPGGDTLPPAVPVPVPNDPAKRPPWRGWFPDEFFRANPPDP